MKKFVSVFPAVLFVFLCGVLGFPSRVRAVVDCAPNSLNGSVLTLPSSLSVDSASGIKITNLPSEYRNNQIFLYFIPPAEVSNPLSQTYSFVVTVDAQGNADYSSQSLSQLIPTIQQGRYSVEIQGGPISFQNPNGSLGQSQPVCLHISDAVSVIGSSSCLNLGDTCDPTKVLTACVSNAFCDKSQNPPKVRLPDLKREILNGAQCAYKSTNGATTCGTVSPSMSYTCQAEILTPNEETLCCVDQQQCTLSQSTQTSQSSQTAQSQTQSSAQNTSAEGGSQNFPLCQQAGNYYGKCTECFSTQGVWTAVGCIPYNDTTSTVRALITIGLGLAGTAVVLMTLAGAFLISTSQGDPKRVEEGRSLITSAVAGILFLIFSVSILRFVGVSVLQLPGFG